MQPWTPSIIQISRRYHLQLPPPSCGCTVGRQSRPPTTQPMQQQQFSNASSQVTPAAVLGAVSRMSSSLMCHLQRPVLPARAEQASVGPAPAAIAMRLQPSWLWLARAAALQPRRHPGGGVPSASPFKRLIPGHLLGQAVRDHAVPIELGGRGSSGANVRAHYLRSMSNAYMLILGAHLMPTSSRGCCGNHLQALNLWSG